MSAHSEENLASPVGYYPGVIGDTLDNGNWKILRKLGWGPRSSTWLVNDLRREDNIEAIKIFTTDATTSPDATNERDVLQHLAKQHVLTNIPVMRGHFYQQSSKGQHLCLVFHVLGASIDDLRTQNVNGGYLPLHNVKKIIVDVAEALATLHENNIVHGAIIPGNLLLGAPQQAKDIEEYLLKHPTASSSADDVVPTQPLSFPDSKWNASATDFADDSIYLSNFKYARTGGVSKYSAVPTPESLSGQPITKKTDIWMLGYTAYVLLTGKEPFSEHITLEDLECFVEKLPSALPKTLASVEGISSEDIPSTVEFVTHCLKSNPNDRPSNLFEIDWVSEGSICSCGACI